MSVIYNVNASFLQNYINFHGKHKLDMKEMFKRLSLEMGGDGEKITKEQVNSYINKAENGQIEVDKRKLSALKQLQRNWKEVSGGNDYITEDNLASNMGIFLSLFSSSFETVENTDNNESKKELFNFLSEKMNSGSEGISKTNLKSYLKTLISKDSENNNDNEIAFITNLLGDFDKIAKGEDYITAESFSSNEIEA